MSVCTVVGGITCTPRTAAALTGPETCPHLLLIIFVVGACQEMAKNELGDVDFLLLVHLHGHAGPVVPNFDSASDLQSHRDGHYCEKLHVILLVVRDHVSWCR